MKKDVKRVYENIDEIIKTNGFGRKSINISLITSLIDMNNCRVYCQEFNNKIDKILEEKLSLFIKSNKFVISNIKMIIFGRIKRVIHVYHKLVDLIVRSDILQSQKTFNILSVLFLSFLESLSSVLNYMVVELNNIFYERFEFNKKYMNSFINYFSSDKQEKMVDLKIFNYFSVKFIFKELTNSLGAQSIEHLINGDTF